MPIATKCTAAKSGLFDDLVVAADERQWEGNAKRLGGFEIDDHLDLHDLLHRQISGPDTLGRAGR